MANDKKLTELPEHLLSAFNANDKSYVVTAGGQSKYYRLQTLLNFISANFEGGHDQNTDIGTDSNDFTIGIGATGDFYLNFGEGAAIRYNSNNSKLEFSHNLSDWFVLGTGSGGGGGIEYFKSEEDLLEAYPDGPFVGSPETEVNNIVFVESGTSPAIVTLWTWDGDEWYDTGNQFNVTAEDTPTSGSTKLITSGGVYAALLGKANVTHDHIISQITGLQEVLDSKLDIANFLNVFLENIEAGTNVSFSLVGGKIRINASGTGGGGSSAFADITGQPLENMALSLEFDKYGKKSIWFPITPVSSVLTLPAQNGYDDSFSYTESGNITLALSGTYADRASIWLRTTMASASHTITLPAGFQSKGVAKPSIPYTGRTAGETIDTWFVKVGSYWEVYEEPVESEGASNYLGSYSSLSALQAAHPTALPGNEADVDSGEGVDSIRFIWDNSDQAWVAAGGGETVPLASDTVAGKVEKANIDEVNEGDNTSGSGNPLYVGPPELKIILDEMRLQILALQQAIIYTGPSPSTVAVGGMPIGTALTDRTFKSLWEQAATGTSNTTPIAPTIIADDNADTISATHTLGGTEILYNENNGLFIQYTGTIAVGNVARAAGYYKFKIKSATGRNESAVAESPEFEYNPFSLEADFVPVIFSGAPGQSNDIGRAESSRMNLIEEMPIPQDIYEFWKPDYGAPDNGELQPAFAGVNTREPDQSTSTWGGSLIAAIKLRDYLDRPVYIINAGDGGTALEQNLTSPDWDITSGSECYYRATQLIFTPAITKIQAANPGKQIVVFMMTHQGESDAPDLTARTDYPANFTAIVNAFRNYSPLLANAPHIITKLYYNADANETEINNFFDTYAAAHSENTYVIDISSQPRKIHLTAAQKGGYAPTTASDDIHTSYLGQRMKGLEAFEIIKDHYGLTGDSTEITNNTAFNPNTINAGYCRLQLNRSNVTISSVDNSITAVVNNLSGGSFNVINKPRFKVDKKKGFAYLSSNDTNIPAFESVAPVGTTWFSSTFSVSVKYKPSSALPTATMCLVHDIQNTGSVNNSRFAINILGTTNAGKLAVVLAIGGTLVQAITASPVYTNAKTIREDQIDVVVNSGGVIQIYFNKVLQTLDATNNGNIAGLTMANYVNNTNKLTIGARRSGVGTFADRFSGALREVVIQPGAYTETNINNLNLN